MKSTLRSVLLAGAAAICISVATSAQAVPTPPNPADFSIIEDVVNGHYTVINNSADWYIREFLITHDSSGNDSNFTTYANFTWGSGDCYAGADCTVPPNEDFRIGGQPTFDYFNFDPGDGLADLIGPGQQASEFFFQASVVAGSAYRILLVDAEGNEAEVSNAVPLPAALPMMGSVFGGGWLLTRWRRRKRGCNQAEAPSPA